MYNFGIPASLKQWIDAICRAGVSFKYTEQGPVGLLEIKRAFIITAGGTPIGSEMDFASRYLEHICRFIGTSEVFLYRCQWLKGSPEQVIAQGKEQVDALIANCSLPRYFRSSIMGLLQQGQWVDEWYDTKTAVVNSVVRIAVSRNWLTPMAKPDPMVSPGFNAEKGRYHLYVSLALPVGTSHR